MATAKKEKAQAKKSSGRMAAFLIFFVLGLSIMFMMPVMVLLLIGFIPTYVALCTDNDPQKSGAVSIGFMNFAGIVPYIIDLIHKGATMPNMFQILMNANSWLVILGAAAIGQLIVFAIPQAIATLSLSQAEMRVKALRKNLDMLRDQWGPEVATTKPLDRIFEE